MPQNLIDTPADWQDVIAVPAPGEPAAIANDPAKPHSLYHALAALAKRTRWLRGLLETHNHDGRYAPLAHNHDDRYYTKAEIDARRTVWAATGNPPVGMQFTVPTSGSYLIEGRAIWQGNGEVHWTREIWINGARTYSDQRSIVVGGTVAGSWADQVIYNLTAGTHSVEYRVIATVGGAGGAWYVGPGMVKVTRL